MPHAPRFWPPHKSCKALRRTLSTRQILTYSLASNAAGSCILASAEIEKALEACALENLVFDWLIGIPGVGVLQALFLAARIEPVGDAAGVLDIELRLAGKPELLECEAGMPGLH